MVYGDLRTSVSRRAAGQPMRLEIRRVFRRGRWEDPQLGSGASRHRGQGGPDLLVSARATCWYRRAALALLWPRRSCSSGSVAPARAAILAPVCRRSCTRRSGRSAASRAIRQCRSIVDGCRCDNPVPPREEESVRTWLSHRVEVVSDRKGRREEAWRPPASLRRSSSTSPLRGAHHAQSSTSARRRSGIASTITSSQSMRAGRISRARGVLAAPRMRHGLLSIASSATAVFMTAFSSA